MQTNPCSFHIRSLHELNLRADHRIWPSRKCQVPATLRAYATNNENTISLRNWSYLHSNKGLSLKNTARGITLRGRRVHLPVAASSFQPHVQMPESTSPG